MPSQKPPPRSPGKGAESEGAPEPMQRFRSLTERLIRVPREEVREAEKRKALKHRDPRKA